MHTTEIQPIAAVLVGPGREIVELEARIRAAQFNAELTALDALLPEDLLFTRPDGMLGTKAQDLTAHGTGAVRFREHVPSELRIRRAPTLRSLRCARHS